MTLKPVFVALMMTLSTSLSANTDLNPILAEIEKLEAGSEPKCYATASRLEDFMFGTPLSDEARFAKNQLQKNWLMARWNEADKIARDIGLYAVDTAATAKGIARIFAYKQDEKGHWQLTFANGTKLQIHKDDKRQYSSVAYSLRALLAVQQESLMDLDTERLPLTQPAIEKLIEALDLYTLATLKVADTQARQNNEYQLSKASLTGVFDALDGKAQASAEVAKASNQPARPIELKMLKSIAEQKLRSYAQYNEVSSQLFIRNLQVYFARLRWSDDPAQARAFRQMFTETLIAFSADLYTGAQKLAMSRGHKVISEMDVAEYAKQFIPHRINEYEDAIFFPKLAPAERVTIESYDMDSFRDSGLHWRYLGFAVMDGTYKAYLEPDPFAAELLVENIAQFGVLLLRVAGDQGKLAGDERLAVKHFETAVKVIQKRINDHAKAKSDSGHKDSLASAPSADAVSGKGKWFTEVSQQTGMEFMHRTSDWLNRQMRTYIKTGEDTGTTTIPPAFGGAGVAAEDINNDGKPDVLVLSGLGNRLYLNRGNGQFEEVTQSAGLDWKRADNQPGEPRQPIIADLDNDGNKDIVITYVNDTHRVYRNLGNAKFQDVTETSQLGGIDLVGGPATVFDYDNDGLLDIYITYFGNYLKGDLPSLKRRNSNGLPNKLFRNLGGFKFKDVTKGSNLDHTGWGQAATHTDLDNDGLQDLIVGNDFGVNAYYRNNGDGTFTNIAKDIGAEKPSYTMGIGLADLNADMQPDIYISNIVTMNKDEKYILPEADTQMKFNPDKLATMRVVEANDLFLSGPGGYELSKAVGRGYSSTGWSWDADFFDFDNDGDDDLFVLNGMNEFNVYSSDNPYYTDPLENKAVNVYIPVATKESNVFFVNDGGKLNNRSVDSGVDWLGNSRSAAYLDMDDDGDLDIVVNNYHEHGLVYRNNSQTNGLNWLKVKLVGAPEKGVNLDAIGSRIVVTTPDGTQRWREVHGTIGYMSVHPSTQHVGLNKHDKADIQIRWPNGKFSEIKAVKAGQTVVIEYNKQNLKLAMQ